MNTDPFKRIRKVARVSSCMMCVGAAGAGLSAVNYMKHGNVWELLLMVVNLWVWLQNYFLSGDMRRDWRVNTFHFQLLRVGRKELAKLRRESGLPPMEAFEFPRGRR